MSGKRRGGRVSFTDDSFAETTSLATLPPADRAPAHVRLEELAHNPRNPREDYSDVTELATSLASVGQLQPVTIVARDVFLAHYPGAAAAVGGARWVVVMGNRRLAAAKAAGLERLSVSVQDHLGGDDSWLPEAALIENIHREALPPLLEARELQGLVERHGSQAAVARRLAKSEPWIAHRLSLLRLAPELAEQLRAGELSYREAKAVASKPATEQQAALEALRTSAHSDPEQQPAEGSPRRRGRPRKAVDVAATAADLRRRLTDEQRAQLVELLRD